MIKRINYLDTLKGLIIILVVIGHIADGYLNANNFIEYNSILSCIFNLIYSFHMPLFLMISGFIYSLAYFRKDEIKTKKIKQQLFNLIYLYFLFSIFQWIFKYFFSGSVNTKVSLKDLLLIIIKPMAPYWYLYNMIFYYIIFYFLYKMKNIKYIKIITLLIALTLGIIFYSNRLLHFLVFFGIGFYINQSNCKKKNKLYIIELIIAIVLYFIFYDSKIYYIQRPIVGTVIALITSIGIFNLFKQKNITNKILEYIGKNSLEIYLIHCYFTALNRVLLVKIGITNFYINTTINLLSTILLCLAISQMTKKLKIHNHIFLPFKKV